MWATEVEGVHDDRGRRDRSPGIIEIAKDLQESEQIGACTQ
jgi:hypothetical protein